MSLIRAKSANKIQTQSTSIVTLRSLTLCLAYIQHYTPTRLVGARLLSPIHLQTLSAWLGYPLPKLRSLKNQPALTLHLSLLIEERLLILTPTSLHLSPDVPAWLHQQTNLRIDRIISAANNIPSNLETDGPLSLCPAYVQLACQGLCQEKTKCPRPSQPAQWLEKTDQSDWWLTLPETLPDWLLYDLLQLGHHYIPGQLQITPLTIASQHGSAYGFDQIRWLLEMALQDKLTTTRCAQLHRWLRRGTAYQLRGNLLTTAQPCHLTQLLQNRRLRTCVQEQLGPRHALLVPEALPRLQRWLGQRGYPLTGYVLPTNQADVTVEPTYHWLGLKLLILLQKQLHLPYPPPHDQLAKLSGSLPPDALAHMQAMAHQISQNLADIGQHRDAYFPAFSSPSPYLRQQITQAIADNTTITIHYQTHGDSLSKRHQVEPYWLEQRGQLYYLHGYSYRAESQLTFRLDRITQLALGNHKKEWLFGNLGD